MKKIRSFQKAMYEIISLEEAKVLIKNFRVYSFGIYKYEDGLHKGFQFKRTYLDRSPNGSKKGVTIYAIKSNEGLIGEKLSEKDFPKYCLQLKKTSL
jgi:hypothetical protein